MSTGSSKTVDLPESTYLQVNLLALAWGVSDAEAVRRLLEHFQRSSGHGNAERREGVVAVHAVYEGERTDALYDPATKSVSIAAGPAQGKYRSPSGAAVAVLQAANPTVNPNRNGWSFWVISETGALLQSIR
ncbi:hypothetical protein ACIQGZ_27340 [Streptomyces sp. NPDC092296]|uniref:hypothetical protein n=1 Tax=Streptomyces sp. NPDC092296 TaxID=3366012 RepID=UPI0038105B66